MGTLKLELAILKDTCISHNKAYCLEHLPRKDFPCPENSRVQKTSIQNSNNLECVGQLSDIGTNQCWEVLTFWNLEPKDKGMVYVYP
jgi:hypothetical protein